MIKPSMILTFAGLLAIQACAPAATPEQQAQRQHNIADRTCHFYCVLPVE